MAEQQNSLKIHRLPFTQVPNDLLCSDKISGLAKALWCVFYSKPDNWTFFWREIESHFKEGRDAVRKARNELEKLGYMESEQKRLKSSRGMVWGGMNIELFPYPNKQIQPSVSCTENQYTRDPYTRQSDSIKADSIYQETKKDLKKKDLSKQYSSKKDLFSLSEVENFADEILREKDFLIDVKKFFDWATEENLKASWKNVLRSWIENPRNQIKKTTISTDNNGGIKISGLTLKKAEIDKLCFTGGKVEERVGKLIQTQEGFELSPVEDFDVEKWREELDKINVRIK